MNSNIHFVYKLVLEETGEFYIGRHSTNDINDDYMGSGAWTRGKSHLLKKEIVSYHPTIDELKFTEAEVIYDNFFDPLNRNYHVPLKSLIEESRSSEDVEKWRTEWFQKKEKERIKLEKQYEQYRRAEERLRKKEELDRQKKLQEIQELRKEKAKKDEEIIELKESVGGDFEVDITARTYGLLNRVREFGVDLTIEDIKDYQEKNIGYNLSKVFSKKPDTPKPYCEKREQIIELFSTNNLLGIKLVEQLYSLDYEFYSFNYGFQLYCIKIVKDSYSCFNGTPHKEILEKAIHHLSKDDNQELITGRYLREIKEMYEVDKSKQVVEVMYKNSFGLKYCVIHNICDLNQEQLSQFKQNKELEQGSLRM